MKNSNSALSIYNYNDNSFTDISLHDFTEIPPTDTVVCIQSFLKYSYILTRNGLCYVLNNSSRSIETKLDIPAEFDNNSQMIFPNSSTAYFSSGLSGKIAVIDISNNTFVKLIESSNSAFGMTYYGHELYVCNPLENKIDKYDTRTDELISSKNTEAAPVLIDYYTIDDIFTVVTAGSGKYDNSEKSAARLLLYKRDNMELLQGISIGHNNLVAENQIPINMGITDLSFVLITTNEGIFRYNLKFKNNIAILNSVTYSEMIHNSFTGEYILPLISENFNQVHILDTKSLRIITVMDFDRNIDYIYPLND